MAFVAYLSKSQPARLKQGVVGCVRQHSAALHEPAIFADAEAASACVAPSRGARFHDGLQILLSGRPTLPRQDAENDEISIIARMYRERGASMAESISGSFAIVVLDPRRRRCLLIRDRLGFVPLFYGMGPDGIWVSDSLKLILASRFRYFTLDYEAIYRYLYLKAFECPDTVVNEIKSARPGTLIEATHEGFVEKRYWDLPIVPIHGQTPAGNLDELESLLNDAVERSQGAAGESTGLMISGGLDSAVLGGLTVQDRSRNPVGINVAFGSEWSDIDESFYAQAVADACDIPLTKIEFTQDRLTQTLPSLWWNNNLPTANSGFKLNLIGLWSASLGTPTTFMLGEGADTILLYGWNWKYFDRIHQVSPLAAAISTGLRRSASDSMERLLQGVQTSRLNNDVTGILRGYLAANLGYLKWKGSVIRPEAIDKLFTQGLRDEVGFERLTEVFGAYFDAAPASGLSEKLVYASLKSYIPNQQLMNYHTACNYFGAELACPYADEKVVEFCLRLPWAEREQKRILKQLAERRIPKKLVHREKCAFLMPMTEWINTEFWPLVDLVFSRDLIEHRGLFDPEAMESLKLAFRNGSFGSWPDIWTFVVLEAWFRINLDPVTPTLPRSVEDIFPELENAGFRQPQRRSA